MNDVEVILWVVCVLAIVLVAGEYFNIIEIKQMLSVSNIFD